MNSKEIITIKFMESREMLLAYIRSIVCDFHIAEDVLQETIITAMQKSETLKDIEFFPGWIRKIARFKSLNTIKKEQNRKICSLSDAILNKLDEDWTNEESFSSSLRMEHLRLCMKDLMPKAQKVIELRYYSELSGQKLADKLGVKITSAYSRLTKIHRILENCIESKLKKGGNYEKC